MLPNTSPPNINPNLPNIDSPNDLPSTNDPDFQALLERYRKKLNAPKESITQHKPISQDRLNFLKDIQSKQNQDDPEEVDQILSEFLNGCTTTKEFSTKEINNPTQNSPSTYYDDFINDLNNNDISDDMFDDEDQENNYAPKDDTPKTKTAINEESIKEIAKSLTINQRIKNYKELCSIFHLKPTTGTAKISQLKTIAQYVNLEKICHSFIVRNVYQTKQTKQDKRSLGNHSIYLHYVEKLLVDYLLRNNKTTEIAKSELLLHLNIINSRLDDLFSDRLSFLRLQNIIPTLTQNELESFKLHVLQKTYNILNSSLKTLMAKSIIHCEEIYYFTKKQQLTSKTFLIQQKKITDQKTIQSIKEIESDSAIYLMKSNSFDKYKQYIDQEIHRKFNYDSINKKICITLCNDTVERKEDISLMTNQLNKRIIEYFENTFKKRCKNLDKQNNYLRLVSIFLKNEKVIDWNDFYKR